jgi:hypothetical protein
MTNHVSDIFYLPIAYQIMDIAFGQSLTNVGRADLNGPLKAGESNKEFTLPSSRSETNDSNAANKPGKQ